MKNFLKRFSKKSNLVLLVLIFVVAVGIRFYNFPNRVTFWSEQARSLVVSASYIKDRPTLLGQEYFRVDSSGHKLFSGALFNYSLVPLLLISNYEPVPITGFFAVLNLLTGLAIFIVVKKIFSESLAMISTALFLFNDLMIYHSLFIWNYNYLPLIGILIIYTLYKKKVFWTGVLSGIGISLQFLFIPVALGLFIFRVWKSKIKIMCVSQFVSGLIIGNLPMVLFDIRHDFYHTRTLMQYFADTVAGKSDAAISYYYLLPFWPLLAIVLGLVMLRVLKSNKTIGIVLIAGYLMLNLTSSKINFVSPTGMPAGITTKDIDVASRVIANNAVGDFNVASVLDFDKRAYVLRYFVGYKYNNRPLGEEKYPGLSLLYVLAEKNYNFENTGVWELNAGGPYNINKLSDVDGSYAIYKLTK